MYPVLPLVSELVMPVSLSAGFLLDGRKTGTFHGQPEGSLRSVLLSVDDLDCRCDQILHMACSSLYFGLMIANWKLVQPQNTRHVHPAPCNHRLGCEFCLAGW